ncbi:DUF4328 domain-containing protein [Novosphingobium sp. RL4]|uniref:DUF4328 domain-containing protein n=1 Tax=Novosphingobium sp. RL4 TaxID=3109595 RepID=UPI002D79A711|nr:DUF4328 domain-containing protein [Novosphingobium sp. RL4]WRT94375.1 DUF4328 domain-containing protein [Novosphingobium sp. RL4]
MPETALSDGIASLARRTLVVRVLLCCYIGTTGLTLAAIAASLASGAVPESPLAVFAATGTVAVLAVYLVCAVAVSLWIHRAHANLFAAGMEGLEFSPGWSVGYFFIPIACLFKPFEAMRALWNRSHLHGHDADQPTDPRLVVWWTCMIAGTVAGTLLSFSISAPPAGAVLTCIVYALRIVAAGSLLAIVNGVARAQEADLDMHHAFA